jgi:hypothetical protein
LKTGVPKDAIEITIDKATEAPQRFAIKATTRGQVSVWQDFEIKEADCEFTVKADSAHDQQIVLAYEENKVVEYSTVLDQEFDFETSDSDNCPANKIYLEYGDSKKTEGLFNVITFTMNEGEKGKKVVKFSVGTEGKEKKSDPQQTATIITCGKEEVTLTN